MTMPERDLWVAVLERGLRDAMLPEKQMRKHDMSGSDYDKSISRRTARAWIGSEEFSTVCYLAGMTPTFVLDRFRAGKINFGGSNLRFTQSLDAVRTRNRTPKREPSLPPGFAAPEVMTR